MCGSWVFCSHFKIVYFFLEMLICQLVSGGAENLPFLHRHSSCSLISNIPTSYLKLKVWAWVWKKKERKRNYDFLLLLLLLEWWLEAEDGGGDLWQKRQWQNDRNSRRHVRDDMVVFLAHIWSFVFFSPAIFLLIDMIHFDC